MSLFIGVMVYLVVVVLLIRMLAILFENRNKKGF